jgi:CRISPR-associated protein Csd2
MIWTDYIPQDIRDLYEIHDYLHAAAILKNEFPEEFKDVCAALRAFRVSIADIVKPGGNESDIPKIFSKVLRPQKWREKQLTAQLTADEEVFDQDTHKVDYFKNRIALDVEWNSKDQTFDRDLYAFSEFFRFKRISLGILITRSNDLDDVFERLGPVLKARGEPVLRPDGKVRLVKEKYGASTTHMGQLLRRLKAGRNGGCPVLVFGMTPRVIGDWKGHPRNVELGDATKKRSRRKYVRDHSG